ncbi:cob(I)yrinic acid a,c-diamide adenosyltransferase [Candidatus Saccharibacteria bacterium]|nr:cob(I)yrinic acid a,c-diamide adenosyltransferase [Candidatus Saccharibacteria bacterium]
MVFEDFKQKDGVVIVYTGDGKGKTSASLGLMTRALGTGWKVAFVQFIKLWDVGEHQFIRTIAPLYEDKLDFYKGGLGFFEAGELSSKASKQEHIAEARRTYEFAYKAAITGDYQLVICDEINNAVHDGLLTTADLEVLIDKKHPNTSLCLTGRNFPSTLIQKVDIATEMTKIKHHFDDKFIANKGIDY